MSEELKPCPFCGCKVKARRERGYYRTIIFTVRCEAVRCKCRPSLLEWYSSREAAVSEWNQRAA